MLCATTVLSSAKHPSTLGLGQQHHHNDCFDGATRVGALAMNKKAVIGCDLGCHFVPNLLSVIYIQFSPVKPSYG